MLDFAQAAAIDFMEMSTNLLSSVCMACAESARKNCCSQVPIPAIACGKVTVLPKGRFVA